MLSSFIPDDERVITIEDAAELQLHQEHVLRLESRPPNIEGRGEVTIRDLVRNSLRMRPDRIVVGEIRDAAALDMLQAMNTGHDGSICTVHANSPRDVLSRVETMVLMAGIDLPVRAIREQVASAIDLIVQQSRFKDGTRHITHITEVVGMEGDVITLQDLFVFDHSAGFDENGRALGQPEVDRAATEVPGEAHRCRRHRRPHGSSRSRSSVDDPTSPRRARDADRARPSSLPAQVASADETRAHRRGQAQTATRSASSSRPTGSRTASPSTPTRSRSGSPTSVVASTARPIRQRRHRPAGRRARDRQQQEHGR